MKAIVCTLQEVLLSTTQWVVPVYQRHYEWETGNDQQIPTMWEDLKEQVTGRLEDQTPYPHYFGAIIYADEGKFRMIPRRLLIDGQQRTTSFHLVLCAIREVAMRHNVAQARDMTAAYLYNSQPAMQNPAREKYKLWSSYYDRTLYQAIVDNPSDELQSLFRDHFHKKGTPKKGWKSVPKLLLAYWWLIDEIANFVDQRHQMSESPELVCHNLIDAFVHGFQLVVISLDENDDAQEIFASLNGLGKPLSPFDLIRNDVFLRARKTNEDNQTLFEEHWKRFEDDYWTERVRQGRFKRSRADHFLGHVVVAETAREINVEKVETEYRRYAGDRPYPTVADELRVLNCHADTYMAIDRPGIQSPVREIAELLRTWDWSTFHPFLLAVQAKVPDGEDSNRIYKLLENYIIRREICNLPSNGYNLVATSFVRQILDSDNPIDAFSNYIAESTSDRARMPPDHQLREAFEKGTAYGQISAAGLRYILLKLENHSRNDLQEGLLPNQNLTVEHIMPRRWSKHWPLPNGENAPCESPFEALEQGREVSDSTRGLMSTRQNCVNSFGNLTLLSGTMNPKIGNGPWCKKRRAIKEQSLLNLNRRIVQSGVWSEIQIKERAAELASLAIEVWPSRLMVGK